MHDTYLTDIKRVYRSYRRLAETALVQVDDAALAMSLGGDDNSLSVIMRHVAGNLRSRFTDFLTTDGEKASRQRDTEFESRPAASREDIMADWNSAWDVLLHTLDSLTAPDLERTVLIRKEPFTVAEALNRSVTHTAYHVGQMVFLAKHFAGEAWTSLSIPKGRSSEFSTGTVKSGVPARPTTT